MAAFYYLTGIYQCQQVNTIRLRNTMFYNTTNPTDNLLKLILNFSHYKIPLSLSFYCSVSFIFSKRKL